MTDLKRAWQHFNRLRIAVAVLYGFFPILAVLVFAMDRKPALKSLDAPIALSYLAVAIVLQIWLTFWRCPRCRESYLGGWHSRYNVAISVLYEPEPKCVNCGLTLRLAARNPAAPA